MKQDFPLVGIGGMPRSGKDSLAELFIHAGYFGLSFGDVVRGFARARHADKPDPISVANMTETSNWLRETRGPDVILQEALNQFEEKKNRGELYEGLVLWSIRAPVEVDWILAHGGKLIWVEADDVVRHDRGLRSLRNGEAVITIEEFRKQEALQWKPQPGIAKEVQMDMSYVRDHATHTFVNNEDNLELFLQKAHELISSLSD